MKITNLYFLCLQHPLNPNAHFSLEVKLLLLSTGKTSSHIPESPSINTAFSKLGDSLATSHFRVLYAASTMAQKAIQAVAVNNHSNF